MCIRDRRYNGVVFNEMKGALSDPMSVLDDAVNAALYPDLSLIHIWARMILTSK